MPIAIKNSTIDISSEETTRELAKNFSNYLTGGEVIFLHGEMGVGKTLVISGSEIETNFLKAASNIKNLDVLSYKGINVYDIVKKENLIIIDDVLKFVEERLLWA